MRCGRHGRRWQTSECDRERSAHDHSRGERDVPKTGRPPVIPEELQAARRDGGTDCSKTPGKPKRLVAEQEKEWDEQPDQGAADVPGPGTCNRMPHVALRSFDVSSIKPCS